MNQLTHEGVWPKSHRYTISITCMVQVDPCQCLYMERVINQGIIQVPWLTEELPYSYPTITRSDHCFCIGYSTTPHQGHHLCTVMSPYHNGTLTAKGHERYYFGKVQYMCTMISYKYLIMWLAHAHKHPRDRTFPCVIRTWLWIPGSPSFLTCWKDQGAWGRGYQLPTYIQFSPTY